VWHKRRWRMRRLWPRIESGDVIRRGDWVSTSRSGSRTRSAVSASQSAPTAVHLLLRCSLHQLQLCGNGRQGGAGVVRLCDERISGGSGGHVMGHVMRLFARRFVTVRSWRRVGGVSVYRRGGGGGGGSLGADERVYAERVHSTCCGRHRLWLDVSLDVFVDVSVEIIESKLIT